ncbi:MAG: hypothetical protein FGM46_10185, partial [Ferruginibacter sp.]|nr:hypothetical protein [Ferruginibacter sp.]
MQIPAIQTKIAQKLAKDLSEKLHAKVSIEKVKFHFFDELELNNLLIEDQQKDTLLFTGSANVVLNDWFFLKNELILKNITFKNITLHLNRQNEKWNYQFLIDYFKDDSGKKKKKGWIVDCKKINLYDVHVKQIDGWIGEDFVFHSKKTEIKIDKLDLKNNRFKLGSAFLEDTYFSQYSYNGNRPAGFRKKENKNDSSLNEKSWAIELDSLNIKKGFFTYDRDVSYTRQADRFDENHILLKQISLSG